MKARYSYRVILILLILVFFFTFHLISKTVVASTPEEEREQYVTSIQIKEGDSLWSIANSYYTKDYQSMEQYIKQIKKCNQITSDKIYAGQYIIVPYYRANDI